MNLPVGFPTVGSWQWTLEIFLPASLSSSLLLSPSFLPPFSSFIPLFLPLSLPSPSLPSMQVSGCCWAREWVREVSSRQWRLSAEDWAMSPLTFFLQASLRQRLCQWEGGRVCRKICNYISSFLVAYWLMRSYHGMLKMRSCNCFLRHCGRGTEQ